MLMPIYGYGGEHHVHSCIQRHYQSCSHYQSCGNRMQSSHLSCHKHCGKCYTSLYTGFDGVSRLIFVCWLASLKTGTFNYYAYMLDQSPRLLNVSFTDSREAIVQERPQL